MKTTLKKISATLVTGAVLLASTSLYAGSECPSSPSYSHPLGPNLPNVGRSLTVESLLRALIFMNWSIGNLWGGDSIKATDATVFTSLSDIDDRTIGAEGQKNEYAGAVRFGIGEDMGLILGLSRVRYDLGGGPLDLLQKEEGIDLLLTKDLSEKWKLGLLLSTVQVRVKGTAVAADDNLRRWGAGIMASYRHAFNDKTAFGYVGGIASMNKTSFRELINNRDCPIINTFEVEHKLTDRLSANVNASVIHALDRDDNRADSSYVLYGTDLIMQLNECWDATLGYQTSAFDNDRNEHTVSGSLTYRF